MCVYSHHVKVAFCILANDLPGPIPTVRLRLIIGIIGGVNASLPSAIVHVVAPLLRNGVHPMLFCFALGSLPASATVLQETREEEMPCIMSLECLIESRPSSREKMK